MDSDLDGEIYAEQLHSLLQRLSPGMEHLIPNKTIANPTVQPGPSKRNLTDEEKFFNQIHGNNDDEKATKATKSFFNARPFMQIPHRGGVFEGAQQGPKFFSQSVMIQTVRKSDGSYESRRTVRDTDGQTKTTITRSKDGKTETITTDDAPKSNAIDGIDRIDADPMIKSIAGGNRNLTISQGYLLPNNLW